MKKLKNAIKTILKKYKFFRKLRKFLADGRSLLRGWARQLRRSLILARYSSGSARKAGVREVTTDSGSGSYRFGFDVLGLVSAEEFSRRKAQFLQLAGSLKDDDINVAVAITDSPVADSEIPGLYMLAPGDAVEFVCKGFRTVFICVSIEEKSKLPFSTEYSQALRQLSWAEKIKADYVVILGRRSRSSAPTLFNHEKNTISELKKYGADYVICASEAGIYNGATYMKFGTRGSGTVCSIGRALGSSAAESAQKSACAVIRTELCGSYKGKMLYKRGYIPYYCDDSRFVRIDCTNPQHRSDPELMNTLTYIENGLSGYRDIRNCLTIGEIFDIIGKELPARYEIFRNAGCGKVCTRRYEASPGDVFFWCEQFHDTNDIGKVKISEAQNLMRVDYALEHGAIFVFSYLPLEDSIPHVVIDDVREAHIKVCNRLRRMYDIRTIGITGSIGKTSTKDMLYCVLSQRFNTYRNYQNSNTQVYIGIHVQDLRGTTECYLQEIGGGRPGGASRHSRMVAPDATIITNIGTAHIGNYGTQEKLMENKLQIIDGMDENGVLYLNGDDPLLVTASVPAKTVLFAIDNHKADYYADNLTEDGYGTDFDIVHEGRHIKARINVPGRYNVLNALCAYAIGKQYGLEDREIVAGIGEFRTTGTRQNLISVGNVQIFADCYNASIASVDSSLSVLDSAVATGRRIAVIGKITGMAELSEQVHIEIGNLITGHDMDKLILFGDECAPAYEITTKAGIDTTLMTEREELVSFLNNEVMPGDYIVFKGSSKNHLDSIIDEVFGTMLSDQMFIDGLLVEGQTFVKQLTTTLIDKVSYFIQDETSVVNGTGRAGTGKFITVRGSVRQKPVYSIADDSFSNQPNLTVINLPDRIRHIGNTCFKNCSSLRRIKIPKGMKYIGNEAFKNCISLKRVFLRSKVRHIGEYAFSGCTGLEYISIPDSVTEIGDGAFEGCANLLVYCHEGSYAESYCMDNGIQYTTVKPSKESEDEAEAEFLEADTETAAAEDSVEDAKTDEPDNQ